MEKASIQAALKEARATGNEAMAKFLGRFEGWATHDLHLKTAVGEHEVSTAMLPVPHPFGEETEAQYETMIFHKSADPLVPDVADPPYLAMQWRYHTEEQARAGHAAAVLRIERGQSFGTYMDDWREDITIPLNLREARSYPEGHPKA